MKRKNRIIMLFLIAMTMGFLLSVNADEHSASEVRAIIVKVREKLAELKKVGAERYAKYEFYRIDDQIKSSEYYLKKGEEDKAYYEIRIGVEYFRLVKARKQLYDSKSQFEKAKSELSD